MSLVTNLDNIFKKGVIGNVRKAQEDSHDMKLKTPNGDVFVVCDGMGGHVGGAKASELAVNSIVDYLNSEKYEDPIAAMDNALKRANDQILGFAAEYPEYKGMGTTACILILQSDCAYLAHLGDSRIYLYGGKEKELHRITKDHSYVQTLVDAGQITDDQAEHHPNKNRILKALGVVPSNSLRPSFNQGYPHNGDIFLICSDGLSGMIPDSTIEQVLTQNSTLEEKGELLIGLAMQGETVQPGGQDNCTLELVQIDNSPWPDTQKRGFHDYTPKKRHKKAKTPSTQPKRWKKALLWTGIAMGALLILSTVVCLSYRHWNDKQCKEINHIIDSLATDTLNLAHKIDSLTQEYNQQNNDRQKANLNEQICNKKHDLQLQRGNLNSLKNKKKKNCDKK